MVGTRPNIGRHISDGAYHEARAGEGASSIRPELTLQPALLTSIRDSEAAWGSNPTSRGRREHNRLLRLGRGGSNSDSASCRGSAPRGRNRNQAALQGPLYVADVCGLIGNDRIHTGAYAATA